MALKDIETRFSVGIARAGKTQIPLGNDKQKSDGDQDEFQSS